jgi:hypothetical protein
MDAEKIVQQTMDDNPEVQLVLEIAARARDTESRELPQDVGAATEVVALPINPQCAV